MPKTLQHRLPSHETFITSLLILLLDRMCVCVCVCVCLLTNDYKLAVVWTASSRKNCIFLAKFGKYYSYSQYFNQFGIVEKEIFIIFCAYSATCKTT